MASSTASVWAPRLHPAVWVAATRTATVDTDRPANDRVVNGTTWAVVGRRSPRPQTQRRLSSKDGTVPTVVATTLATTAATPNTPTSTPSTARLVPVDTPETAEYRRRVPRWRRHQAAGGTTGGGLGEGMVDPSYRGMVGGGAVMTSRWATALGRSRQQVRCDL